MTDTEPRTGIDDVRDLFRDRLLHALDEAARIAFPYVRGSDAGATDADLPRLFAALDVQIDILVKRHRAKKKFLDTVLGESNDR